MKSMKLTFGVLAGLVFVSTVAVGQYAHDDFYNRVIESQVDQYRAEISAIRQAPTALAGINMRTGGQQLAKDTFSQSSGNDFYNGVLAAKVDEEIADNNAVASSANFAELQPMSEVPSSMAASVGADAGALGETDWYDRVVATQAELNRRIKQSELPSTF